MAQGLSSPLRDTLLSSYAQDACARIGLPVEGWNSWKCAALLPGLQDVRDQHWSAANTPAKQSRSSGGQRSELDAQDLLLLERLGGLATLIGDDAGTPRGQATLQAARQPPADIHKPTARSPVARPVLGEITNTPSPARRRQQPGKPSKQATTAKSKKACSQNVASSAIGGAAKAEAQTSHQLQLPANLYPTRAPLALRKAAPLPPSSALALASRRCAHIQRESMPGPLGARASFGAGLEQQCPGSPHSISSKSSGIRPVSRASSRASVCSTVPADPSQQLVYCHVLHSQKRRDTDLSQNDVKRLVELQISQKAPVRPPWYRDQPRSRYKRQVAAQQATKPVMHRKPPPAAPPAGTGVFCPAAPPVAPAQG